MWVFQCQPRSKRTRRSSDKTQKTNLMNGKKIRLRRCSKKWIRIKTVYRKMN
jgi:hypothetical protein